MAAGHKSKAAAAEARLPAAAGDAAAAAVLVKAKLDARAAMRNNLSAADDQPDSGTSSPLGDNSLEV